MASDTGSKIADGRVSIRHLNESDLPEADRIYRLAFGTFAGLPNPETFAGDTDLIRTRWLADPAATLGAEVEGALVGSNFVTRWGSVGFFGPLTLHPSMWERKIGQKLLEPTMSMFEAWQVTHAGLFTFPNSPKHAILYQKFDFWPRFLTMVMSKPVAQTGTEARFTRFSALRPDEKTQVLKECRAVTDSVYAGLDVEREIRAVDEQHLGDTILVADGSKVAAFAVCHCGPGTEAGSGVCYIKVGVVRCDANSERNFRELLKSWEAFAAASGQARISAGVSTSRSGAYRCMLAEGFRIDFQGIVLERGNKPGYNREDVYLLDDWR